MKKTLLLLLLLLVGCRGNTDWATYPEDPVELDSSLCSENYTIVNRHNYLGECHFDDLVSLWELGVRVHHSHLPRLREEAAADLLRMAETAREDEISLIVSFGYRDRYDQLQLFTENVSKLGSVEAELVTARPGHSEHILGTSVDFVTLNQMGNLNVIRAYDEEYKWLRENASDFGFIHRYPPRKESITQFRTEQWHWRWIGVADALEFESSGAGTFDEWIRKK